LNKIDLLNSERRSELEASVVHAGNAGPVLVSAMNGQGIDELLRRIDAVLPVDPVITMSLRLPLAEGRTLALVHALGRVLHSSVEDSHMTLEAEVPVSIAKKLQLRKYGSEETSRTKNT
jgi:GTP-binding protein HflX